MSREYIERLLSISPPVRSIGKKPLSPPADPAAAESAGIAESLTDRELEVLACMARGMKYRETADHLFVSLNTVRFHVKSIYGKLAVDTRMKAIEKARAAGLLR